MNRAKAILMLPMLMGLVLLATPIAWLAYPYVDPLLRRVAGV